MLFRSPLLHREKQRGIRRRDLRNLQGVEILGQRGKGSQQYTVFSDSASAMDRVRSDRMGPSQRLAIATHEAGRRIADRDNTTIRWAPAHQGVKDPPRRRPTFLQEMSLSHMTRRPTGTRSQTTRDWIAERVRATRRYRPPRGSNTRISARPWQSATSSCRG